MPNRWIMSFALVLTSSTVGCGDEEDMMTADVQAFSAHMGALDETLRSHHRTVVEAPAAGDVADAERTFTPRALGHMDEMMHRMRDMGSMCATAGRPFEDAAPMVDLLGRLRGATEEHERRMRSASPLADLNREEERFRDEMAAMMTDVRGRQAGMAAVAGKYHCRMHRH